MLGLSSSNSIVSGVQTDQSRHDMKCYSDKEGMKFQQCKKKLGYRTCFTEYDKSKWFQYMLRYYFKLFTEGQVLRRGCSTKMPMFHVECENHISGTRSEKFCYCSYDLCNRHVRTEESLTVMAISIIFGMLNQKKLWL